MKKGTNSHPEKKSSKVEISLVDNIWKSYSLILRKRNSIAKSEKYVIDDYLMIFVTKILKSNDQRLLALNLKKRSNSICKQMCLRKNDDQYVLTQWVKKVSTFDFSFWFKNINSLRCVNWWCANLRPSKRQEVKLKREKREISCLSLQIMVSISKSKTRNDQTFEWISWHRLNDFMRKIVRLWSWRIGEGGRT